MSNQQMNRSQTTRKMRDSGIEWIGEVPNEWTVSKLKFIANDSKYSIVDGPFGSAISTNDYVDSGVPLIRITNLKGTELSKEDLVYIRHEKATSLLRSSIKFEDIVFAKTGATVGKCSLNSTLDFGILASSCVKITINKGLVKRYFLYLFKTSEFQRSLIQGCGGSTRDTINLTPFKNLYCVIPPLQEQQAIASYLDEKVGKIDSLISEQKQAIEQWKEYKQSLITETVTKGLNPDVEMKDSGIEWIGEIPRDWEVVPIKYVGKFVNGYAFSSDDFVQQGIRVLKISNIQHMRLDWSEESFVNENSLVGLDKYCLKDNDLIFALTRPIISSGIKVSIFNLKEKAYINQRNAYFRSSEKLSSKWLLYIMLNYSFIQEFEMRMDKTGQQPNISTHDIGEIKIPLPSIDEQQIIVNYLDKHCLKIDETIEQKQGFIKQLEEYKQSLIYECVTGKRRVL